ncbi:MarR family winged helix-turn-helix transcriptional regulator [Variovorax sp. E3]|uniref:MarR family winged helix-turn-helix transcriptional regulator n=1 Tax=Variovorax sp. E3 TaxID=1914993 RepID=UPI0018DB7EFA|nr:MarR family winged helix-turn-helix transcriptional regulator [Variovorax sp. E3]
MTASTTEITPGVCNSTAIRKAARRLTRFYDACMAGTDLRATQYTILNLLAARGSTTMATLADMLSMDRATMGHNLRPLEREGFITIEVGRLDRRAREIALTPFGIKREAQGKASWLRAQATFEEAFGKEDALAMRRIMARITALDLDAGESPPSPPIKTAKRAER